MDLVRQITEVEGQIFLHQNLGLPAPQDQLDELDRLAEKAWRVDELQKDN